MNSTLHSSQVIFATAGYDHTIRFWEAHSGICLKVLPHNESQVNCMAIHPNKKLLATAGFQHVSIYDFLNPSSSIYNVEGTVKNTIAIGFNENGNWMYTAGEDKTVKLWEMKDFYRLKQINCIKVLNHTHPITCAALHPNQVDFLIGDEAGNLVRWDIRMNQPTILNSESKVAMRSLTINQEGNMMAIVNNEGNCWIWSLTGGFGSKALDLGRRDLISPHKRYALKVLFSPDSTLLATSSADGTAKIWTTVDLKLVSECKDNMPRWVWDMAFTCDSEYLFTVSSDKLAKLWKVKSGECVKNFVGHQKPVVCLAYSDTKS